MPLPLETARLRLRPASIGDVEAWHAVSRDAERAWFGESQSTLEDAQSSLERQMRHQERYGFALWVVEQRQTGEVIGVAGLRHLADGPEVEVGYRFLERRWGNGYATEAARAAIDFGFDEIGLERIVAVTRPDNRASRRVMEKCGLSFVGVVHVYGYAHVKYAIARN
jgi:RimJ/RimL family protein N-acetyltransferase